MPRQEDCLMVFESIPFIYRVVSHHLPML